MYEKQVLVIEVMVHLGRIYSAFTFTGLITSIVPLSLIFGQRRRGQLIGPCQCLRSACHHQLNWLCTLEVRSMDCSFLLLHTREKECRVLGNRTTRFWKPLINIVQHGPEGRRRWKVPLFHIRRRSYRLCCSVVVMMVVTICSREGCLKGQSPLWVLWTMEGVLEEHTPTPVDRVVRATLLLCDATNSQTLTHGSRMG